MDTPTVRQTRIRAFLREHHTGVLATVSRRGEPHAATISYLIGDDLNIYFMTRRGTQKFRDLMANRSVALAVGTDLEDPRTVQVRGEAELLSSKELHFVQELSQRLVKLGSYWWPVMNLPRGPFVFFCIKVNWFRWLNLSN